MLIAAMAIGSVAGLGVVYLTTPPQLTALETFRPMSNTLLYDDTGQVFGSLARERRIIAQYDDYPKVLYDAVLSIEDRDFERHSGVSVFRLFGAAYHDLVKRDSVEGASTLTMQLARGLFLSPKKTYSRKLKELCLAIQIERHFTKQQIFTLYANQIYLGHGIYGFATGANFYFGKPVKDLNLDEAALLAALPKAPNTYSPIHDPSRALSRRNLVISSMLSAHKITASEAAAAKNRPIRLHVSNDPNALAPYFVEEVREYLEAKYGSEQVLEGGFRVYTTLDIALQKAANRSVMDGLSRYERRHGWHSRLQNVKSSNGSPLRYEMPEWSQLIEPGMYLHALVTSVSHSSASLRFGSFTATLSDSDVVWTEHSVSSLLRVGDLAFVKVLSIRDGAQAQVRLEEESDVQGALVAIDNLTGGIKAMVGGRSFNQSQFNRATQAFRQVGSSFKPFVYTAAIDQGATPDDIILDSPIVFTTASGAYVPQNYDQQFEGPITLRHALAESRNIPALKIARTLGMKRVIDYAHRFGLAEPIPPYLPVALGAVELTLLEHTSAFSVFPSDGVRFVPHYIVKVTDYDGHVLEDNRPVVKDVISQRTARIMTSMLRDVVLRGTGNAANRLSIPVAGKTGTTNNFTDAWFMGFSPAVTCGVWVGFDRKRSLGNKETGAMAALPIWIDFMSSTIATMPHLDFAPSPDEEPGDLLDSDSGYASGSLRPRSNLDHEKNIRTETPASSLDKEPAGTDLTVRDNQQ